MVEAESRTGCGKCADCKYHDMKGYDNYCTRPDRMIDGQSKRWMNGTFSRGWHDCCVVFDDED